MEDFDTGGGNLAARSVTTYTFTASIPSTATPGSYDLNAGVWDSSWNTVAWSQGSDSGVTLTVRNPSPYAYPVSISASTVARGGSVTTVVGVSAGSSALSSAIAGFSIVPSASSTNSPVIATQNNNNVNLAAGATGSYSFTATVPTGTATGQYRVTLALWDVNWNTLTWLNDAFYLTVN